MLKRKLKKFLPGVLCRSAFLSNLYYFVFSGTFSREHQAVLAGKARYLKETDSQKENYYLLVRNTHRIEKGLLMRPRKAQFATSYIAETVNCFENIWNAQACVDGTNSQQKWFRDVLEAYFEAVVESPKILQQKKRYKNIVNGYSAAAAENRSIPYERRTTDISTISYDEFYRLSRQRRSVRWFQPRPVPRELIDKALLAARQSPSACNRQPYEFRIFDDPEIVNKLVDYPMGTKGYAHGIPVFAVIIGNLDAYAYERDRHLIYIDGALAAMPFMLALETLGLSSCPINWPDIEDREKKLARYLKLETFQRPIMCLGLGYADPDGKVAYSEKRSLDQMRNYNYRG